MDAPQHYRLTDETKTAASGRQLFRIQALVDLPKHEVKAGDLGGWVQSTENLGDTARVSGNAVVGHTKDYLTLGPLGSDRFITLTKSDQCVTAGCFRGTVAEFVERVARDYPDGSDYARALPFIQSWLNPQPEPPKKKKWAFWK